MLFLEGTLFRGRTCFLGNCDDGSGVLVRYPLVRGTDGREWLESERVWGALVEHLRWIRVGRESVLILTWARNNRFLLLVGQLLHESILGPWAWEVDGAFLLLHLALLAVVISLRNWRAISQSPRLE